MFKKNDVVRIKPEWCDGPSDRKAIWNVVEVYDNTNRCTISLVNASECGHPFGFQQLVDMGMIEEVR